MKNLNIKDFHIPTYMVEAIELDMELADLDKRSQAAKSKLESIKKKLKEQEDTRSMVPLFKLIAHKCYPKEANTPLINAFWSEIIKQEIESFEEFRDFIGSVLFRIYFSKGEDKVFDLQDENVFDDEKCQKLFDQEIYIPENWLDQFVRCLNRKDANEDMILHNLTPEWLWPKCFSLLMELYGLTKEAQLNKHK